LITIDSGTEHARLTALADRFTEALAARDPQRLPVAPDLRVTENCQPVALGTGIWRTCRGVRPGGHCFADVERGQAAWWGVIEEIRGTGLFGVRLAVEGRLITEIEIVVVRGGAYFDPDVVVAESPEMHAIVPEEDRVSGAELVAVAHSYFDAINRVDGRGLPVSPDTVRLVNGFADSAVDAADLSDEQRYLALDVSEQITQGHYSYIERIRDERFTLIDEERGLCHCTVMFDHPGNITRPNGDVPFGSPNTMIFFEIFKVTCAGIRQIWAIGASLPYGATDGWS
jgi:hypothetical protein